MPRVLITGITGQDGSYLAELLLKKKYEVYGMYRRSSVETFERILHIKDRIHLVQGDLSDAGSIVELVREIKPQEIYNLAAQSFVPTSWQQPTMTADITGLGALRILEAVRHIDTSIKVYQASSSEMFGKVVEVPQKEGTPFYPRSPYGVAKVFAYWIVKNYRESYGMFACNGILFNHESPRRGLPFVTRKISHSVAKIKLGMQNELRLGNLDASRDWGHARDYVEAMWLMMQQKKADDYVIATGKSHSVRDFCEIAFSHVGLDWKQHVKVDKKFFRPAEVDHLVGNATKAKKELGWTPRTSFKDLVTEMVDADLKLLQGT